MPSETEIVRSVVASVEKMLEALEDPHGTSRGTFEAAIAESQGASYLKGSGEAFNHAQNMRDVANRLERIRDTILGGINRLRNTDAPAAGTAHRVVEPLLDHVNRRMKLARDTEKLFTKLDPARFQGERALPPRGRSEGTLASNQLRSRGLDLVPPEVAHGEMRKVLDGIRGLPVTDGDCREEARKLAALVGTLAAGLRARDARTATSRPAWGQPPTPAALVLDLLAGIGLRSTNPRLPGPAGRRLDGT